MSNLISPMLTSVDNSPVDYIPSIHCTIINNPKDHSVHLSSHSDWDDLEHLVSRNSTIYATAPIKSKSQNRNIFSNNSSFVNQNAICYNNEKNNSDESPLKSFTNPVEKTSTSNWHKGSINNATKTHVNVNMGYNGGSSIESMVSNQNLKDKNDMKSIKEPINEVESSQISKPSQTVNESDKKIKTTVPPISISPDINQIKTFKNGAKTGHSRQWGSCGSAATLRLLNFESATLELNDLSIFNDQSKGSKSPNNPHEETGTTPLFAVSNNTDSPTDDKGSRYFKNYPVNLKRISQASFEAEFDSEGRIHEQISLDLRKIDPHLIAGQITLIELSFFKAMKSEEFLSFKWTGPSKHVHAPGIVASTKWFNQLNFWAQRMILEVKDLHKRADMLAYFIRIIKKLVDSFNNLSSGMTLMCALDTECIHRLKQTWAQLSSRDKATFKRMEELFSGDNNYANLRLHITSMKLPCIPYIGLYLTDLTFINTAHSKLSEFESQTKTDQINNILRVFSEFQQSQYDNITPNMMIIRYLESQRYIEELQKIIEDNNYRLSTSLEPLEKNKSSSNVTGTNSAVGSNSVCSQGSVGVSQTSGTQVVSTTGSTNNTLAPLEPELTGTSGSNTGIINKPPISLDAKKQSLSPSTAAAYRCVNTTSPQKISQPQTQPPASSSSPSSSSHPPNILDIQPPSYTCHHNQPPTSLQLPITPLPLQILPPSSTNNNTNPTNDTLMGSDNQNIQIKQSPSHPVELEKYPSSDSVHVSLFCGGKLKKSSHTTSNNSTVSASNNGATSSTISRSLRFKKVQHSKRQHLPNNNFSSNPIGSELASSTLLSSNKTKPSPANTTVSSKANSDIGIGSRMHSMSLLDDSYLDDSTNTIIGGGGGGAIGPSDLVGGTTGSACGGGGGGVSTSKRSECGDSINRDSINKHVHGASSLVTRGDFSVDNQNHHYQLIRGSTRNTIRSSSNKKKMKKGGTDLNHSENTTAWSTPPIIKCKMKKDQFNLKPKANTKGNTSFINLVNVANAARVAASQLRNEDSSATQVSSSSVASDSSSSCIHMTGISSGGACGTGVISETLSTQEAIQNTSRKLEDDEQSTTLIDDDDDDDEDEFVQCVNDVDDIMRPTTSPDQLQIICQGLLSRKTYRKPGTPGTSRYRAASRLLSMWQRYWIVLLRSEPLSSAYLVYFQLTTSSHSSTVALSNVSPNKASLSTMIKHTKCYVQDLQQSVVGTQFTEGTVTISNKNHRKIIKKNLTSTESLCHKFFLQDSEYGTVYKFKSSLPSSQSSQSQPKCTISSSSSPASQSASIQQTSSHKYQPIINPSIHTWYSLLSTTLTSIQRTNSDEHDLINLTDS